jgi:aconitate hydratase
MAEFTLSRKDPQYVARAKKFAALEKARNEGGLSDEICATLKKLGAGAEDTGIGSVVYAVKPGDGSAREQAASCQRVLGGWANIAREYATKRYRSNLINWGMLPLLMDGEADFECGDFIFLKGIKTAVEKGEREVQAWYAGKEIKPLQLALGAMTGEERKIVLAGCLINYYKEKSA